MFMENNIPRNKKFPIMQVINNIPFGFKFKTKKYVFSGSGI